MNSADTRNTENTAEHDPGEHDPSEHDPSEHDPSEHDPSEHDPSEHDPGEHDPGEHDPGEHDPGEHDPGEQETGDGHSVAELTARVDQLTVLVQRLQASTGGTTGTHLPGGNAHRNDIDLPPVATTSRRHLIGLGGASAVGIIAGSLAGGARPVAAADPNDVVKNVSNPVTDTTTMDGTFPGPVLSIFNRQTAQPAYALYGKSNALDPTIRADNDASGGVGLAGNAPGGRDILALGSGRIAMNDHQFGNVEAYTSGELHQSGGTIFGMVSPTQRREIVGPGSAGALHPVPPTRVYDSRQALPAFGRLNPGEGRIISVADGRSTETGAVSVPGLVPPGATAIMFNLTVTGTVGPGYLNVSPGLVTEVAASTINWTESGTTLANASMVGLSDDRLIRVWCAPSASTDFIVDILGYYA